MLGDERLSSISWPSRPGKNTGLPAALNLAGLSLFISAVDARLAGLIPSRNRNICVVDVGLHPLPGVVLPALDNDPEYLLFCLSQRSKCLYLWINQKPQRFAWGFCLWIILFLFVPSLSMAVKLLARRRSHFLADNSQ